MKLGKAIFLCAWTSLLAASPVSAQSIVGAWTAGDTTVEGASVLVFLANGSYFQIQNAMASEAPHGFDGFERGTYTWNPVTGALTVTTVQDLNGDNGLSDLNGISGLTFVVSGDAATVTIPGEGPITGTRVTGASPIVGAWSEGNANVANDSAVVVFLPNGVYFMAQDGDSGDPTGHDGIEHGTYAWNPATGLMTSSRSPAPYVDTNGEWGLSHTGTQLTFLVSADGSTLNGSTGPSDTFALTRVSTAAVGTPTVLATLTLGHDTAGVVVDTVLRRAYVSNYASGTMSVIDLDTNTANTVPVGTNPRRLLSDAAHGRVYVVNDTTPGGLTVVDAKTNTIITQIPTGSRSRSIAADFQLGEVYVGNRDSNSITVVDIHNNTAVATVPVGRSPGGIDVNTRLGKIYVVSGPDNTISVIDQRTRAVTTVAVGRNPGFARADSRTGKVYVNNVDDRTISVIGANGTVIKTIPGGAGTTSNFAAVSLVYRRVYLANAIDNTLSIIDTDTDTIVRTVPVGPSPQDVVVDNGDANLYVVNQAGNSVTILDARSETVVGSVPVGGGPWRISGGLDRMLVLNSNGSAADSVTIMTQQETIPDTEIATEWYHQAFDHYFHAVLEPENRLLADGLFGNDWNMTYEFWRVWTQPGPGRLPVCRFFSATFAPKSSHFFTPRDNECELLKTGGVWQYEGTQYYLQVPDAAGNCGAGTAALYRLYNDGQGGAPNHRLTANRDTRNAMVALGWTAEGDGPDIVFACTPTLRGD